MLATLQTVITNSNPTKMGTLKKIHHIYIQYICTILSFAFSFNSKVKDICCLIYHRCLISQMLNVAKHIMHWRCQYSTLIDDKRDRVSSFFKKYQTHYKFRHWRRNGPWWPIGSQSKSSSSPKFRSHSG